MTTLNPILAITFDCFGTLVRIARPTRPFSKLTSSLSPDDRTAARTRIMTNRWDLREAAENLEISISDSELCALEDQLSEERASIECFPETMETLKALKEQGYKLALCSNLAMPYAAPVDALVGSLFDVKIWSCQAGALKPSPKIYEAVHIGLGIPPYQILMVGDDMNADYLGARVAGLAARHLVRNAGGTTLTAHQITSLEALLH